jgi:hypothetical protein
MRSLEPRLRRAEKPFLSACLTEELDTRDMMLSKLFGNAKFNIGIVNNKNALIAEHMHRLCNGD